MKNNGNINKKSIFKKIAISTLAIGLSVGIFALNMIGEDPNFSKYKNNYNSDLAYIKDAVVPTDTSTVTMTEAAALGNNKGGKTITIGTAEELYLFSQKTKTTSDFLGYSYKLIDNINYNDVYDNTNNSGTFDPIGYSSGTAFSGTFDGDGYEISNLIFSQPSGTNRNYYAMFWSNSGTITELGLVDPSLTITSPWEALTSGGGIAYLVGENTGTISYCFVKDLVDSLNQEKANNRGITAPGARIATLCVTNGNTGILSNNYVAVDTVINNISNSPAWAEIALANNNSADNSISNCYYYNDAISYINSGYTYFKDTYSNLSSIPTSTYGIYKSKADLKTQLQNDNVGWYTAASYGVYSSHVGIDFGIKRGVSYDESTHALSITNAKDFAYMYELFNTDDYMASNSAIYNITQDINLANLPVKSYTYKKGIGATIEGTSGTRNSLTLVTNTSSSYPTIFNAKILDSSRKALSSGVDCYGLFNYLTGTVKNINIYVNDSDADLSSVATSTNVKGIGILSGYIEKGFVDNVNVYANFDSSSDIGEYHIGGITGILGGVGIIRNSSAAGSMEFAEVSSTIPNSDAYMNGIAIGGIVGYVEASLGHLNTCTSAVNINCKLGTLTTYAIGGVIGAGYTTNYSYDYSNGNGTVRITDKTGNLENDGTITLGQTSPTYSNLYVAGVIGRHLGMTAQVENFNNSGAISVISNSKYTYVAGVENADILSSSISGSGMTASEFKGKNGKYLFYASSFTNGENVTVTGNSTNLHYTNVLNINAKGVIESTIDGIFNLAYNEKYNDSGVKTEAALTAQSIDMNLLKEFAPVLNVVGATDDSITYASTVYNLRSINYATTSDVADDTTFRYAGVASGSYINYDDVRNEGELTITLANYSIGSGSKLYVSGLFDTLSGSSDPSKPICFASNLYNGGNITVNEPNGSTATKNIDMYLAGICNQNLSVDNSENQNPLKSSFDSSLVGTMDSIINKGNITVSSAYLNKTNKVNNAPSNNPHYVSNIYIGGITYVNSGIISNAYNLGKLDIAMYSTETGLEYLAGGISCKMDGQYAQIRDSANNGDIYVIDVTKYNLDMNPDENITEYIQVTVIASGIVATNYGTANTNNNQVISFTINYGQVIGFQSKFNMDSNSVQATKPRAIASGILGKGFCNLVNIINYGNVCGSECSAGIVSIVKMNDFSNTETSIANTLNYGQIRANPLYYANDQDTTNYQTYNTIISLEHLEIAETVYKRTYVGAISTIFDFGNRNKIKVRYLINFYGGAACIHYNLNIPTTNKPTADTFITARGSNDLFGDQHIKYAPLSTIDDEYGNIGIFSDRFVFRQAIDGINLNSSYVTDSYIPNFFQFIRYDKVNPNLLDEINWRTIAYSDAAEQLVKNITALSILVDKSNSSANSKTLLTDAFASNTWLSNCNSDIVNSILDVSFEGDELEDYYSSILNYILFDTTCTSQYNKDLRTYIVEAILNYYYEKYEEVNYYELLQTLLYPELFAKIVSEDNANYKEVKDYISDVLKDSNNLSTVLDGYISALNSDDEGDILNPLFDETTGSYYENAKISLLTTLLSGYDDNTLELIYKKLDTSDVSSSNAIKYKLYLTNHTSTAAELYSNLLLNNSLETNPSFLSWMNTYSNKYNFETLISNSNLTGYNEDFPLISSIQGWKYPELQQITTDYGITYDTYSSYTQLKTLQYMEGQNITSLNRTPTKDYSSLWNVIKNDSAVQAYILNSSNGFVTSYTNPTTGISGSGIIAKATEMTNSYQSNDRPQSSYGIPENTTWRGGISGAVNNNHDQINKGLTAQQVLNAGKNNYSAVIAAHNNKSYSKDYYDNIAGYMNAPTSAIRSRFIYTPDEVASYRTNYFGPYVSTAGDVYSAGGNLSSINYNLNMALNTVTSGSSGDTKRSIVPIFISIDEQMLRNIDATYPQNNKNDTYYEFYWNDANVNEQIIPWYDVEDSNHNGITNEVINAPGIKADSDFMWKSELFTSKAADNTTGYIYRLYENGQVKNDINNYVRYGYDFSPTKEYTKLNDYLTMVTVPGSSTPKSLIHNGKTHTDKQYYLKSYCTANMITGIWYMYSVWDKNKDGKVLLISMTYKNEYNYAFNNNNGYFGVHTTDYIGYSMADMVNLDGVRTKGNCGGIKDEDEINIIGAIVEKLLSTNEGKELALRAVARYNVNNDFTSSTANALKYLVSAVDDTEFAYKSVTDGIFGITTLNTNLPDSVTKTVAEYLDSLLTSSTKVEDITSFCVYNKLNFRQILLLMLPEYSEKSKRFENYQKYNSSLVYARSKLNNFIYEYIKYKLDSGGISWSDLDSIFTDSKISNETDLTNLERLLQTNNDSILANLNLYYDSLSDIGKFVIKDIFVPQDLEEIDIYVDDYSYIEILASGDGIISITYEDSEVETITVNSESNEYYECMLYSGSYQYEITSGDVDISAIYVTKVGGSITCTGNDVITYSDGYDSTILLSGFDYSSIASINLANPNLQAFNTAEGVNYEKYQLFYTLYPYYRYVSGKTNAELNKNDIVESLVTLMGTIKLDSNDADYYSLFNLSDFNSFIQVTSGSYDSAESYFKAKYEEIEVTTGNFTTDGSLYTRSGEEGSYVYIPVTSGDYSEQQYFAKHYELVDIDSSSFTTDGSLYINRLVKLINKIGVADFDNDAFYNLYSYGLDEAYYDDILSYFISSATGRTELKNNVLIKLHNIASQHTNSDLALYFYAGYLGNNYLENSSSKTSSIMYTLLNSFNAPDDDPDIGIGYQFIKDDEDVYSDIVTLLINYLSNTSNINIDGYGIYALSSSHGIGYGIFIPDNMDLSTLDVYYQKPTTGLTEIWHLIPKVVNNVEQPKSSQWRGGDVLSSEVSGTVDYAFYHDMKQLKLSISTDIFELDFNDNSIKSVDDQIDNENGVITYYLSQSALNSLNVSSTLTISNKQLANGAKIGTLSGTTVTESTSISLAGATIDADGATKKSITKQNAFRVYAEDTSVYKDYTIVLLRGTVEIDSLTVSVDEPVDTDKVPATGGKIIATVTGIFPSGMDLEPYIHILENDVEYANTDEKTYWSLDPSVSNNGVVNSDGTGATITLIIDKSLPGSDNITFELDVFGVSETATFKKKKSSGNSITTAIYDGTTIFGSSTTQEETYIPFGRAFDYAELTDYTSPNFYLYKFVVSDNAKIEITATMTDITRDLGNGQSVKTGRVQYTVTYKITSETGSSRTYTHTLIEKDYFTGTHYAYLYADGNTVLCLANVTHVDPDTSVSSTVTWDSGTAEERLVAWLTLDEITQRPYYLYDGTYTYSSSNDLFNGTSGSSLNDDIKLHVAFNRAKDLEPQYRVRYDLSNFYTLGSNVVFSKNDDLTSNTAVSETYAGLTVTVSNNDSVGNYKYVYCYRNTGTWLELNETSGEYEEVSYERYYEFPELRISKLASTDALLHNLTFLDQAVTIGNTATVILPNQVLIPNTTGIDAYPDADPDGYYSGTPDPNAAYNPLNTTDDQIYNKVFESSQRQIQVQRNGIIYGGNTNAKSIKDYFIIGTVSDADLTNYCPTFTIDSGAEIYKYTTLEKLQHYGEGVQTQTDKVVLTNHEDTNTMFIYVPFTNGTETEVFLVQLTSSGMWTNVYRTEFNGSNANGTTTDNKPITVGAFDGSFGAKDASGMAIPNTTYVVSSNKGSVSSNPSLYMDYIGTPLTGHFWYVSYVVFSEDKLADGNSEGNIRYYHISIIDLTNNIQFYVKVYAPSNVDWRDIYMTVSENIYGEETNTKTTKEISAFAEYSGTTYSGSRDIDGYKLYTLAYDLQSLPGGYFRFSVDIPYGYIAKSYTDMANQLNNSDSHYEAEKDAFLPKTAIITQKVNLEIVISQGEAEDNSKWAVAISDVHKEDAKYSGLIPTGV